MPAKWEPKNKSQVMMEVKYRSMSPTHRMKAAVELVMTGQANQSEAARRCGVSRSRLNENVGAAKARLEEQNQRSKAALAERLAAEEPVQGSDSKLEEPGPESKVPTLAVTNEVRRVPPFEEFARTYFGNLECPDCGKHHELPGFHVEMMTKITDPAMKRLLINCPPYHAKVLSFDTPIPTPSGWTTIGELAPGDEVFDKDGKVCHVVALSEPKPCRRRVVLGDGSEFLTDADHRWWVEFRDSPPRFVTTAEVAAAPEARRFRVPLTGPLELPEVDLPVDPYVLGAWLGDGHSASGRFTAHPSDAPHMRAQIEAAGYVTTDHADEYQFGTRGLTTDLRRAGVLDNKHVPAMYLRASAAQRMALLQGLMDTDGTVNVRGGQVSFCNKNEQLAGAVFELAASLGWKPRQCKTDAKLNGVSYGVAYRVQFCPSRDRAPFRLQRKIDKLPEVHTRQNTRPFTRIDEIEPVWGRCIAVSSPTQTFLAGRAMVPTGNSTVGTVQSTVYELCRDPNSRTLIVSKSERLAQRFLYQIVKHLTDPVLYAGAERNLIEDWGPFQDTTSQWNKSQIYVAGRQSAEKDPSVSTLGVGGHIYGVRADRIIFDDVADLENQRNSERVQEMLVWATQEAASRVGKSGKLVFIGTRVSAGDIYSQLQGLPAFEVIRYPCIVDEEQKATLWPEHFPYSAADLQRSSMSAEQWQLVYQNVDTPGFGASFPPEVVEACHDPERVLGQFDTAWTLVAGLDPAGANSQSGYTALVLLGVDMMSGRRALVDFVNAKQLKAPQLRDQIFDWADRYPNLRELRVESNGLQSQLVQYNQEILNRLTNKGVRVVPHITTGHNKWDPQFGVESMAPLFYNRQISLPWGDMSTRNRLRTLEDQLFSFPMGRFSDLVMALWFAELGVRDVFQRGRAPMFHPRMKVPGRLARQRRVIDFASGEIKAPTTAGQAFGRPAFVSAEGPSREEKFVNVSGSVTVW